MSPIRIVKGGIEVARDSLGNLTIKSRGNGVSHVQHADVPDLEACLEELRKTDNRSGANGGH